jgi:hypothetical protein
MSSQRRVASSVQPGTTKRVGAVTSRLGRTVINWCVRKWPSCGLAPCTVAALAVAHKVINSPKAKTDRIAHLPYPYLNNHQLIMCAREATAPTPSGFTIDQIGAIMGRMPALTTPAQP